MEDIKIKDENGKFRLRVSGMIIKNNKILVHETQNLKDTVYLVVMLN